LFATSLLAQTAVQPKEERVWTLQGLRAGYCVRFLVDAKVAARELKQGLLLLRADQDQSLHPALRQVIKDQPEFAGWTPSSLCFYYTDAVQVGTRRIAENNKRIAQMIGAWTLGTVEQGTGARRDLVVDMFASRDRLRNAASANLIQLHEAEAKFRPPTDTSGTEYRQKIGKTQLIWSGRTAGDSTRLEQPIIETWQVAGARGVTWSAKLSFNPTWVRALAGSFRVEGKGDLVDMLTDSPIRFVGPFYHGGGGQLTFTR
jgi:hypothetical protein